MKTYSLPENIKPFFWSYDFSKLNPQKDKRLIVVNIINYGKWRDWQWLIDYYGKERIKKSIKDIPATEFRPRALKLISLLLDINQINNVPRCFK